MISQPMKIPGAFVFDPIRHQDSRGYFQENFKVSEFVGQLGFGFTVKQVNQSSSGKGVIRGIHFAETPPGQAKYVSCTRGAIWDVVVDLRIGSPCYGTWEGVVISEKNGKSVFICEGLGHGFLALDEDSVVIYQCSEEYRPGSEHQINPFDEALAIDFQGTAMEYGIKSFILSEQDRKAPTLEEQINKLKRVD